MNRSQQFEGKITMEFALSEDQRLLQDSVIRVLGDVASLDNIRLAVDDVSKAESIEVALESLGVLQLIAPEDKGGLGLGLLDASLVQQAHGNFVASSRMLSTVMAIEMLKNSQKASLVTDIVDCKIRIAIGLSESTGARRDAGIYNIFGELNGKTLFSFDVVGATHILIADNDKNVHLIDLSSNYVSVSELDTIDRTRKFHEVVLASCPENPIEDTNLNGAILAGRLLLAADSLGVCETMLNRAVEYSLERKQFNRIIGSFQAVKHLCAEMVAKLEPARALVWHAAHAVDTASEESDVLVCLAKSHLSEVGTFIARTAIEVHGGMGFTDLLGLHYWFKRIGVNRQLLGSPENLREEAAKLQNWN